MAAAGLRKALRPEHELTVERLSSGLVLVALIYALAGGLGTGASGAFSRAVLATGSRGSAGRHGLSSVG